MKRYLRAVIASVFLIMAVTSPSAAYTPYIPPLYVNSFIPASANIGQSYSASFVAIGGTYPYSWSYSGTIPPGMSFSGFGGSASISGTPTSPGMYSFWVTVTDSSGQRALSSLGNVMIYDPNAPPSISKSSLKNGVPGKEYSDTITASNGQSPKTWAITGGSLPPGITFVSSGDKAMFSGTPTEEGEYTFSLKVTDGKGRTDERQITVKICYPPLTISGWIPTYGYVGSVYYSPYGARFSADDGVAPYTWRITRGSIPPGMVFTDQGNGENGCRIIGTPLSGDTYNFTIQVTDGKGRTAEKDLQLLIKGGKTNDSLYIDGDLPDVTLADWTYTKYDYYINSLYARGGRSPFQWSVIAGNTPRGLELKVESWNTEEAKLIGWPSDNSSYAKNEFILKVIDADGRTATKKFSVKVPEGLPGGSSDVKAPYTVPEMSGNLPASIEGKSYSGLITVSKGKAPYTWSADISNLPDGLALSFSDSKTGNSSGLTGKYARITGTPKSGGYYAAFMLKLTDANGNTNTKIYTFKVVQKPSLSGTLPVGTRKGEYSGNIRVNGWAAPYTLSVVSGALPDGLRLKLSGDLGVLSGTPTKAGQYSFKLKATDGNNLSASRTFSMDITQTVVSGELPANATRKANYSGHVAATGGAEPYTWSVSSGKLPDGLTLSISGDITGTLTKSGSYTFTLKARDKNGAAATKSFTVKVTQTTITGTLGNTTRKASYTGTLKASGGVKPYTWSVSSGKLPDGLKLNASTGKISGSPTKSGSYTFTLKARDKNGAAATKSFTVKVTQTTITGTLGNTTRKASYTGTLKASGGVKPYTWSVSSGKLPDGLKLNASTGKISGSPTKSGSYTFTVKARDKNGAAATKSFTIKVTETALTGTIPALGTRLGYYSGSLKASGGTKPYTWSVDAGKLPDGTKLTYSGTKAAILGTLTKAGTYTFTLKVKDKNGAASRKKFTIKVTQTTLTGTIPATATTGSTFTFKPKASGGASPYSWSVSSGNLPNGLTLNASTGKISGTLTKAGTFKFTLKAKDKKGAAATKSFTLKVTAVKAKTSIPDSNPDNPEGSPSSGRDTSSLPSAPEIPGTHDALPGGVALTLHATLTVSSSDILEAPEGRDSDLITVKAGRALTFILGKWGVEVSGVTVFIDDKPAEGITVSDDDTFILPAEMVSGDFKIYVKATHEGSELESETIYIISQ